MIKQKICIIGNGLTGLTAALILGKLNLDVHLIAAPDKKRRRDIRNLIRQIENMIIKFLKIYKVKSNSDKNNIGIWVKNKKIAAIGVRVSRWVAYHGFSINIKNNLNDYKKIIPCGLENHEVTSLKNENKIANNVRKNLEMIIKENLSKI